VSEQLVEAEHRVTPLELFFDLVFVFGFTQVTTLLLDHVSWGGLGRGLLVLAVLWWAWASYAWLTNTVDAEAGRVMAVILVAIGAMFVAALAVPEAFGSHRLVFGLALLVVLATFIGLFALAGRDEPDLLAAVLRMSRKRKTHVSGDLLSPLTDSNRRPPPTMRCGTVAVGCHRLPIGLSERSWSAPICRGLPRVCARRAP
jgi:low temperature requirement protein LtrA